MSRSQAVFMVRRRILWLLWRERNFLDIRRTRRGTPGSPTSAPPGVDEADMAGHSVETMIARYSHSRRESFEHVRKPVG
jgi:hypothetical protein